jgi:hypothetical protein
LEYFQGKAEGDVKLELTIFKKENSRPFRYTYVAIGCHDTRHYDILYNDPPHNDIKHNHTHNILTFGITTVTAMALSIKTPTIMGLIATLGMLIKVMLSEAF